jgi:hypothetical protein
MEAQSPACLLLRQSSTVILASRDSKHIINTFGRLCVAFVHLVRLTRMDHTPSIGWKASSLRILTAIMLMVRQDP